MTGNTARYTRWLLVAVLLVAAWWLIGRYFVKADDLQCAKILVAACPASEKASKGPHCVDRNSDHCINEIMRAAEDVCHISPYSTCNP